MTVVPRTDAQSDGRVCPEPLEPLEPLESPIAPVDPEPSALLAGSEDVVTLLGRLRMSLDPLRRAGSLTELLDLAPHAAAEMGFDRVLLSRVEDSFWIPERIYVTGDTRWAEEILEAGRSTYRRLDGTLLETQLVRRGIPIRVTDPGSRPLMHRELIESTRTPGYVAVPIDDGQSVIGFLHADCYHQERVPSVAEAEMLWSFARSLGSLLSLQVLRDRLDGVRNELASPTSPFGLGPAPVPGASMVGIAPLHDPQPGTHPLRERVTRREADVLALMAAGANNEQISRRLVISVGTVKSHVKRILRKLGAANRAEAVSYWLRSEYRHLSVRMPDAH